VNLTLGMGSFMPFKKMGMMRLVIYSLPM
jgi:hypothetical protein